MRDADWIFVSKPKQHEDGPDELAPLDGAFIRLESKLPRFELELEATLELQRADAGTGKGKQPPERVTRKFMCNKYVTELGEVHEPLLKEEMRKMLLVRCMPRFLVCFARLFISFFSGFRMRWVPDARGPHG